MAMARERIFKRLRRGLSRIRHFRGHGIHSPYIYRLYREALMRRCVISGCDLYESLQGVESLSERSRVELQNIYTVCGYEALSQMVVYTLAHSEEMILEGMEAARQSGTTVVIVTAPRDIARAELCERVVQKHRCTSFTRPRYLLLFNNHLPKQHFQL